MPLPTRHFLGWDNSLPDSVARWLLGAPDRLPATLVIVPTSHSARRLRQTLARDAGGAVISPHFQTPDGLFRAAGADVATPLIARAAWLETLLAATDDDLSPFFPDDSPIEVDTAWALATIEAILPTLDLLAEVGVAPSAVPLRCPAAARDADLWRAMEILSKRVDASLETRGLVTPILAKCRRAAAPALPTGVRHVVVAGVPDPVPLAIRALESLIDSGLATVDVLVHAPADLEGLFDVWGCPDRSAWEVPHLPLPGGNAAIVVARDDTEAAAAAVRACVGRVSAQVAMGVPDESLVPALERAFAAAGWPTYNPGVRTAGTTGLRMAVEAWIEIVGQSPVRYEPVSRFLRTSAAWDWLAHQGCMVDPFELTSALDLLQSEFLPETLQDATRAATHWEESGSERKSFGVISLKGKMLNEVFLKIAEMEQVVEKSGLGGAAEAITDALAAGGHDDGADGKLLDALAGAAADLAVLGREFGNIDRAGQLVLWRASLPDVGRPDDGSRAAVDLLGWLELPYQSGDHLVVAGMHDGMVPDGQRDHALLPDSQRAALGLRDRASRAARDAFLWRSMVASRESSGSVTVILSKFDGKGEPRKPSSLLLRCPPDELPARVAHCFAERGDSGAPRPPARRGAWILDFPVDPHAPVLAAKRISPTLIRDYLACPFTFYLKHVFGMDRVAADAREMDPRMFGSVLHRVLEIFGRDPEMRDCDHGESIDAFFVKTLDTIVGRQFGSDLSLPLMVQVSSARERLRALAYEQAVAAAAGWTIVAVEWPVGHRGGPDWLLAGERVSMTIDRVDFHPATRTWRVLDYKTGVVKSGPEGEHLEPLRDGAVVLGDLVPATGKQKVARRWKNVQLPMYAAFLRQHGGDLLGVRAGDTIEAGYVVLPRAVGEVEIAVWKDYAANGPGIEASALAWSEEAIRRIRAGEFWPPSGDLAKPPPGDFAVLARDGWRAALGGKEVLP